MTHHASSARACAQPSLTTPSLTPQQPPHQRASQPTPAFWLSSLALSVLVACHLTPGLALAQTTPTQVSLPAQPLGEALLQLANQFTLDLAYNPQLVSGLQAPAVHGQLNVDAALTQLLAGTGITFRRDGRTVLLARADTQGATQLAPVLVHGSLPTTTEGSGSYTAQAVTVGRTAQSLREVPRSVSVLTRAQLDDQRMATFDDAIEQLPGITLTPADGWGSGGYYARGHAISSFLVDGAPSKGKTEGDFSFNTSMAKYDSVQFLHGPDGLFSGNGQPSGSINLIRKRPLDRLQLRTTASAGSWRNYLGEVDITGPLNTQGSLRGRLVAAYNDTHKFYDYAHRQSRMVYGIVSLDVTDRTQLNLGFSHDSRTGQGNEYATALPRYTTGELLPVPRSIGLPAASYLDTHSNNVFAELEHSFNDDWRLRVNASRTTSRNDVFLPYYNGAVNPLTGTGTTIFRWVDQFDGRVDARAFDVHLSGAFNALARRHRVMLGADYLRTHNTGAISTVNGLGGLPIDWATFDPGSITTYRADAPASFRDNLNLQKGLYAYGDFQIHGPLRLVLGGRYARYENTDGRYRLNAAATPSVARNNGHFLPYYALVYDVSDTWTVYATHARSYEDQSHRYGTDHEPLSPTTGRSLELGIKGEHADGRLNTNLTLYRTDRRNYAVKVSDDPSFEAYGGSCCYSGDGSFRAQGVEMQVSGELLPGWQLNAGYTYDDNKTTYGSASGQRYSTNTPKHTFRLWSSYQLPGAWSALRVGGGVRVQSSFYRVGTVSTWNPAGGANGQGAYDGPSQPYQFTDPGRAVWNAFAEYAVHTHWTVALNVNNVFDKHYLQAVGSTAGGNSYGEPRSFYLTLRGTY